MSAKKKAASKKKAAATSKATKRKAAARKTAAKKTTARNKTPAKKNAGARASAATAKRRAAPAAARKSGAAASAAPAVTVVITGAARTPFAPAGGALASVEPAELAAAALFGAAEQAGIDAPAVEEVILGRSLAAGEGQNPARRAAIAAGCDDSVAATTVSCGPGSGLVALVEAWRALRAGDRRVVLVGGADMPSRVPFLLAQARQGSRLGTAPLVDGALRDALHSPYENLPLAAIAGMVARAEHIGGADVAAYVERSIRRAGRGNGTERLVSVRVPGHDRKPDVVVEADALTPAPAPPPTVDRDGNPLPEAVAGLVASVVGPAPGVAPLADGAAALALMTAEAAAAIGARPLARVVAVASAGVDPTRDPLALPPAIAAVLAKADWDAQAVDFFEVDESLAVAALLTAAGLDVDIDRINPHGGALAVGHPGAATGARLLVAAAARLADGDDDGPRRAVVAAMAGGGLGWAVALEKA